MKLIADSGSTKTDWLAEDGRRQQTGGINPVVQQDDDIRRTLLQVEGREEATHVYYYGAGVRPEQRERMRRLLGEAFTQAVVVEAESDLLGAARALCGCSEGVACILGTGANSCLYDGTRIVRQTPALGYVLDDYGGGTALGRRLLLELYKGSLTHLQADFEQWAGMTLADIIGRVYRQPLANRWLASLSEFVAMHQQDGDVNALIINNFREFVRRNILPYQRPDLPVSFVGSIAYHYAAQLAEACQLEKLHTGTIVKGPAEGIAAYHKNPLLTA